MRHEHAMKSELFLICGHKHNGHSYYAMPNKIQRIPVELQMDSIDQAFNKILSTRHLINIE
jgi:hypothetical protein